MPKFIYGTAWKEKQTTELVVEAILQGFRGIDTACQPKHYKENFVGEALEILYKKHGFKREDLFLQTKFTSIDGQDPNRIPYDKTKNLPNQVRESFEVSLKNLKTDYIDSLVLHSPMRTIEDTLTVWNVFEEFIERGVVKQLGISNIYAIKGLKEIFNKVKIKPSVIQNRFYADTEFDKEIRQFCLENGIYYQSFWTLTANPIILRSKQVENIASKYKLTHPQVLFKYLIQIGVVPLTGTKSKIHMIEDLSVLELKDFNKEELDSLTKLL